MTGHFIKSSLSGKKKFPLVLMLEPTHRCNLACIGCDRIRTAAKGDLTVAECLNAAKECGAPVVAVTGGEPFIYPGLKDLLEGLFKMGKFVYLCTNGLAAGEGMDQLRPDPKLTLNFHIDGMQATHDQVTNRPGTFQAALAAVKKAKQKGFRVSTNTTVYKNSDLAELESLFGLLTEIKVDGMLISPAFAYQSVENDIFFKKEEIRDKFRRFDPLFKKFPFMNTPIYTDFLQGKREMHCTPWGNPTYSPLGWKSPCYLITDGYYKGFSELIKKTDWKRFEEGLDPRCANCMVHGGYETTVMRIAFRSPREMLRLALWNVQNARK